MPSRTPSRMSDYAGVELEEPDADIDALTDKLKNAYAVPKKKRSYKKKDCERNAKGRCIRSCKYGRARGVNGLCPKSRRCKKGMKRDPLTGECEESLLSRMRRKIRGHKDETNASRYNKARFATVRKRYKELDLFSPQSRRDEEEMAKMGL
jgi:hypothetical protein